MNRRRFLALSTSLAASALLAACGGGATPTPTSAPAATPTPAAQPTPTTAAVASPTPRAAASPTMAASKQPFKIGVVVAQTGNLASSGRRHIQGMQLALEELGNAAAGRTLELIPADSAGNPEQAATHVRRLVESEKVDVITGFTITPELTAVRDYLHQQQQVTIVSIAGWPAITRDPNVRSPYIFRSSFCQGQYEFIQAEWAYQKGGYRNVVLMAPDYQTGRTVAKIFGQYFQKSGGQIAAEIYPPLDTTDFGPYLQRVLQEAANADAVWAWFIGADAIRFMTQYQEFGLKDQFPLLGGAEVGDDPYLPEVGEAALGIVSAINYAARYQRPQNQEFVRKFQQKFNVLPGHLEYWGYITVMILAQALEAVKGDTSDKQAFLTAIKNVSFEGPMNRVRFHPETQGVITTVLVRRVDRLPDGTLGNVVISEYPDIHDLSF
ncbi:MAG: ABC transporter substrate-binding protein [Thermomicrobium sp.]|nr:ABC transporter substrate-binding protein [Thermomicrobium sp.]